MVVYKYGDPKANIVLIQPVGDHDVNDIENEVSEIRKRTSLEFQMIAVRVDSWNQELSPWRAPSVFGNEDFGDSGSIPIGLVSGISLVCKGIWDCKSGCLSEPWRPGRKNEESGHGCGGRLHPGIVWMAAGAGD